MRKVSSNQIGVERIFPLYAPLIKTFTVTRRGSVRRAKLYYLRNLAGKAARLGVKKRGLAALEAAEEEVREMEQAKEEAAAAAAAAAAEEPAEAA